VREDTKDVFPVYMSDSSCTFIVDGADNVSPLAHIQDSNATAIVHCSLPNNGKAILSGVNVDVGTSLKVLLLSVVF
jgi:hypothetical protein